MGKDNVAIFSFLTKKEKERIASFLVRHKVVSLAFVPIVSFLLVNILPDIVLEEPSVYQVVFISVLSFFVTVFILLYQGVAFSVLLYSDKKFNRYLENKKKQ